MMPTLRYDACVNSLVAACVVMGVGTHVAQLGTTQFERALTEAYRDIASFTEQELHEYDSHVIP